MKIYFMKKDALRILKSNLDFVYTKYFTESDNKWMWQVCNGNPFEEYLDIPNFSLTPIVSDLSKGEIEFENCKLLYQNLSFLTESQACDERLWAGLCNSVFYDYLRRRWDYDKKKPKTQKEAVSNIKSRFFFSGGSRAGLYRNSLAKLWWVGHNTYDGSKENVFENLDIIGSNDISTKINDIFYSNNFSANPTILGGIVKALKNYRDEETILTMREHIRPSLQLLNAIGGSVILDCLDEHEIAKIMIDNIDGILQGNEQGFEVDEYEDLDENGNDAREANDINEPIDLYVAIGQHVKIVEIETNNEKIISVNYLPGSTSIPPLAKLLIGKMIGDKIFFQGKNYRINEID